MTDGVPNIMGQVKDCSGDKLSSSVLVHKLMK